MLPIPEYSSAQLHRLHCVCVCAGTWHVLRTLLNTWAQVHHRLRSSQHSGACVGWVVSKCRHVWTPVSPKDRELMLLGSVWQVHIIPKRQRWTPGPFLQWHKPASGVALHGARLQGQCPSTTVQASLCSAAAHMVASWASSPREIASACFHWWNKAYCIMMYINTICIKLWYIMFMNLK